LTGDATVTVADRPTPAGGHCEIIAAKRPFTACDKLAPPAVAQGEREMLLGISIEFLDDVFGRIAGN